MLQDKCLYCSMGKDNKYLIRRQGSIGTRALISEDKNEPGLCHLDVIFNVMLDQSCDTFIHGQTRFDIKFCPMCGRVFKKIDYSTVEDDILKKLMVNNEIGYEQQDENIDVSNVLLQNFPG